VKSTEGAVKLEVVEKSAQFICCSISCQRTVM